MNDLQLEVLDEIDRLRSLIALSSPDGRGDAIRLQEIYGLMSEALLYAKNLHK